MYAIIETGGKQYKVSKNDEIYIELLPENKKGDKVEFKNVLLVSGDKPKLGAPYLKGVSVSAKVLKNGKQKKVIIFKYKDKNNDARKQGHRQPYTLVKIESINLPA